MPARTVLSFAAASIGQIGFVYSTLEELLLLSSPASRQERLAVHDQLGGGALLRSGGSSQHRRYGPAWFLT